MATEQSTRDAELEAIETGNTNGVHVVASFLTALRTGDWDAATRIMAVLERDEVLRLQTRPALQMLLQALQVAVSYRAPGEEEQT